MHKKIESELVSIAHSILQMKNKEDVLALKAKAGELYEKLSVLAFVDRYVAATPDSSKEEILEKAALLDLDKEAEAVVVELKEPKLEPEDEPKEKEVSEKVVEAVEVSKEEQKTEAEAPIEEVEDESKEVPVAEEAKAPEAEVVAEIEEKEEAPIVEDLFSVRKEEKKIVAKKNTLEKELEGTISLDVTTDLFENAVRVETTKKSLNDVLVHKNLQIGLNDRIAFVKHLFDGSQEDFNRVVSQLNSFKSEKEAIKFVTKMVKSDYDWSGKEEYEERFITLITRKFA
ncbi:hypothetical protein [Flavicella sp.]|uniref:hypothetical protein n=1 Tax=Flavicella sp. TaxID=2957742 RepID=UPI002620F868|nr:hypothetical protein [Flavicella sp.]MDG1805198.1 hypothetical protein [Flavicella sp.]